MRKTYWLLFALPYMLYFLGIVLNQAAIHANNGHMPVLFPGHVCMYETLKDDVVHNCIESKTHLKVFCDWLISNDGVFSLGDKLMDFSKEIKEPSFFAWALLIFRDAFGKQV